VNTFAAIALAAAVLVIFAIGAAAERVVLRRRIRAEKAGALDILKNARADARRLMQEARAKEAILLSEGRTTLEAERTRQNEAHETAMRLLQEENTALRSRGDALDRRAAALDERERDLRERAAALESREADARRRLEEAARLPEGEARALLLSRLERELVEEEAQAISSSLARRRETARAEAAEVLSLAVQRYAGEQTPSLSTTVLPLPDASWKARIIGREGRNIRAFEAATGVSVLMDDVPGAIVLSCFDPARRDAAAAAMERLIGENRINPAAIEEALRVVAADGDARSVRAAEDAVEELNLSHVPLDLLRALGRLRFRTSYSQNVLRHSVETARIAGMLAQELGLSGETARRAGLFHDIGKALPPERGANHAEAGADLLKAAGEEEDVVSAVRGHHREAGPFGAYAAIVAAADAVSAARPGAREGNAEEYLRRNTLLEETAHAEPGVAKAYAMEAGRELRVFVEPEKIGDAEALVLARKLASRLGRVLPGGAPLKIAVIRETRAVEYAR